MLSCQQPGVTVSDAASQIMKTEGVNNVLGYFIQEDPRPIGVMYPTAERAEEWVLNKFDPLVDNCEPIRGLIRDNKTDRRERITHKSFPGGFLFACGSNSANALAGHTLSVVFIDEADRSCDNVGNEGDSVDLFIRRTENDWRASIIICGTPTVEGWSKTEAWMKRSDFRCWFVPCWKCGHRFWLQWRHVDFKSESIRCPVCGAHHHEEARVEMVRKGEWRSTQEGDGRTRGFHINGMNNLFPPKAGFDSRIQYWINEFRQAKGNPTKLRVWVNTFLAETYKEDDIEADAAGLADRLETYPKQADMPDDVLIVTGGVDVQADRIEIEMVGWGVDEESWGLGYYIFQGDTRKLSVWADVKKFLRAVKFTNQWGVMLRPSVVGFDSGHQAKKVYKLCREMHPRKVYACKGTATNGAAAASFSKKKRLILVGTDTLKESIYSRVNITEKGPGYMHYPVGRNYPADYFEQLTSEKPVVLVRAGVRKRVWNLPSGARNEALDIRVYAEAALNVFSLSWRRLASGMRRRIEARKKVKAALLTALASDEPVKQVVEVLAKNLQGKKKVKPRRDSFAGGGWTL